MLTNQFLPVCYIDEEWFYKVNRRRKLKFFPNGAEESEDIDQSRKQSMLSIRFPIKTMFMTVVGRPMPHRNFDGKIHIERISNT